MGAVLSVSAVSFSAGTLTSTAHGQVTGNGPVRLLAGSGGAIPTGLAGLTDYWLIVVDANTVKLASSSANAMSNTPVSFSSNGTLPLSLLLGIPYARARTNAPGTQVFSADLNSFQDTLTAIWNLLTAQAQSIWSAIALAVNVVITGTLNVSGDVTVGGVLHHTQVITRRISPLAGAPITGTGAPGAGSYATTVTGAWKATAAGHTLLVPLPVSVGEEIQAVRALVSCGTTDVIQMQVWRMTYSPGGGPGHAQLGATQTSAGHATTIETLAVTGLTELPGSFTGNYFCSLDASAFANAPTVYGIELDVSVP
ncbi:MAG TPA: hypothetical protein VH143_32805 [Kofleriaceae bacterium]|nr:hypothetical protein [Kofleriaceae bacterium]